MLIDKTFELSDGQAVTASAPSTNVLDLSKTGKFAANPFFICCRVATAAAASGAATVQFSVQTSDSEAFSSYETVAQSDAIAKASLTADSTAAKLQIGDKKLKRYIRGYYTVATGPLTAGAFDMYGVPAVDMR